MSVTAAAFDFSKSHGLDTRLEARMAAWLGFFCNIAPERLGRVLGANPELTASTIELVVFRDIVAAWTDPVLGCRVGFGGRQEQTLTVMPEAMARALIGLMLGAPVPTGEEAPSPRPLTRVEQGLIELLMGEICAAWMESWPELDSPRVQPQSVELNPTKSRLVSMNAEVIRVAFTMKIEEHSTTFEWLFPATVLTDFLCDGSDTRSPSAEDRTKLESLVRAIPVKLVVRLGEAKLDLRDLARLKSGDLILLDKKLGQPLDAVIGTKSRFVGWPGRVGNQQVYQIAKLANDGADGEGGGNHE